MSVTRLRRYRKTKVAREPGASRLRSSSFHPFEAAVLETLRRRRLVPSGARVLVALSGGPDSTALLAALASIHEGGLLGGVSACHVDHRLRPDSATDGDFCQTLCARLGVDLERAAVSIPEGENVQAAARRERYAALRAAARRQRSDRIATGHTRGDQAETLLHRLLRGSGARGLAAIPARRGALVRPLIDRSRSEIMGYLTDRGLGWRDDPTNASARYLRNRIRSEVLPVLAALAPGVERRLARAADLLREDDRALERLAARVVPTNASRVEFSALLGLPVAVRRRAVRRLWRGLTGSRRGLGAEHVEAVLRHLRAARPKRLALPGRREARIGGGIVELGQATPPFLPAPPCIRIQGPGAYALPGAGTVEVSWTSGGTAPWPLELRGRRPGDRFRPDRGRGSKKLKAWLIDRKVPRGRRDALVLVADLEGRVLWIPELGARAAGTGGLEVRWLPG